MTDVPHFGFPFRFVGAPPQAAVDEQDSVEEIAACVNTVLLCPLGFRDELPEFGIGDPTFASPGVDVGELSTAVQVWEPRAQTIFEQVASVDELVAQVKVLVNVRTEE